MAKQDKDPDGSSSSTPLLPPQPRSQGSGGNPNTPNPTKASPVIATARSVRISAMSSAQIHTVDTGQSSTTQSHHDKASKQPVTKKASEQLPPPRDFILDVDEFREQQDMTYDKLCEMVKDSDIDSFLAFKEELMEAEEASGGINLVQLTQRLRRIELTIRGANILKSNRETAAMPQPSVSKVSGKENAAIPDQPPSSSATNESKVQNGTPKVSRSSARGVSFFEQEFARILGPGFEGQVRDTTRAMIKKVTEIMDSGDLEAFLRYKEESLAGGEGSESHLFLKEGLERLERNIRAGNTSSELDLGFDLSSRIIAPETENASTVESKSSKKKKQKKRKAGHEVVEGGAAHDELSVKTDVEQNEADLGQSDQVYGNSTNPLHMDSAAFKTHDLVPEAPKKGKKKRGKKKPQASTEGKPPTATAPSTPSLPTCTKNEPEHTCNHKSHGRCSHTSWKNDDSEFSRTLAETIRELLITTPLDTALRFDLHVGMNKVKRRMDEVEAAEGDSSILRTKKHVSTATKPPFSAFGKVDTPELLRAAAIHLLSSPKYYNGFLDYIEHLNYLVACGDEKAPAMADEADAVYNVVTTVYKEVSDIARARVDAAGGKGLTESEIHEKQLAESAKKMRDLQNLEQGIKPTETSENCTSDHKDTSSMLTELETKALSLIKQPAVLRRFLTDYRAMRVNKDAYGSFWGEGSHLLYQKLVEMGAVANLGKKSSSQGGQKLPQSSRDASSYHEKTIDSLINASSTDEAFSISSEYLSSNTVDDESRQAVASYYAANESKLKAFLLAKSDIEERFKSSGDAKLKSLKEEADRLWECIVEEQRFRKIQDRTEVGSEAKPITNPSKTRNFVDKIMREMVEEFATSPTGIRRFIWPLKFIAEHPSIAEKTRMTAVCVLTNTSLLASYEPVLESVKEATWNQINVSTLSKLSPQQHVQFFMDAVGFMRSTIEGVSHCILKHNANRNQFIIPLTKRAGLPMKARVFHTFRDYEFAYNSALDDDGRAAVNEDFCLPYMDCPNLFRETADELYENGLEFAAFMEQKDALANLPACFANAKVRHSLISSALMLESALVELDLSARQDRVRVMEVVAASSPYPLPSVGSIAKHEEAYISFFAATQKVKANFVREDARYEVAGGKSGYDNNFASRKFGFDSKEYVPYFLGMWMTESAKAQKPPVSQRSSEPPKPTEETVDPSDNLTPTQKKIKKQILAANYRQAQKVPLSENEVRAKAKKIVSDTSMLSSFFKSKDSMEYGSDEDTPDEKFFMDDINRIWEEIKRITVGWDAELQDSVSPTSSPAPPPAAQPSARKEVKPARTTDLPKYSTLFPENSTKPPQSVTADFETHLNVRVAPTASPILPCGRVVTYTPLGLPTHFDTHPLPSDPELGKEFVIYETAIAKRQALAASYAKTPDYYDAFQAVKREVDDDARGMDLTTDDAIDTKKLLSELTNLDTMSRMLRVDSERDQDEDDRDLRLAVAELLFDLDNRPRLMSFLESLEQLYDPQSRSKEDAFEAPFAGPEYAKRYEELAVTAYHGLFAPEEAEVDEPTKPFSKIPRPQSDIANPQPFIGTYYKTIPIFTNVADVVEFATDFYPELPNLASGTIPVSHSSKSGAKLSEIKIQKVLGGLDAMPVPPKVVANLYKSRGTVPKTPRFSDAEEAMESLLSQMEGATGPVSVSILPNLSALGSKVVEKYVSEEYTVVPDSTPEGQALGKAMEDIQLSACKGDVPTDYQMAALGKARRELYASRRAKAMTATDQTSKSLSVSTRAEKRAAANLLARSEAVPFVGMMSFPDVQSTPLSWDPNEVIFSTSFPRPQPTPFPPPSPSAPNNGEPDALQTKLRASLLGLPHAPAPLAVTAQLQIDRLFSEVFESREYQTCRAFLNLPDPATAEGQALISLNKVFGTYKGLRSQEVMRVQDLLRCTRLYQRNVIEAREELRSGTEEVDAALARLDEYKAYNKRVVAAFVEEHNRYQKHRREKLQRERRAKGMGKKLGAYRKSIVENFDDPEEYCDGPKLGSFPVA